MQARKPGSVIRRQANSYHLSSPGFTTRIERPTRHAQMASSHLHSACAERRRDLFGLTTRKVYRAPDVTTGAVGSYPTFSPLPRPTSRSGKSVFCGTVCPLKLHLREFRGLPVRKYDALCCPDFPLLNLISSDRTACINGKNTKT
jgi:hypothetical protein